MFKVCSFILAMLMAASVAAAQDKTTEIDKVFDWVKDDCPGCAVAVSLNGKVVVNRAYGLADLERSAPISEHSIFDAGSLQKQFVAAAALLLVEDQKLSLDDDIRKHIPELPEYDHKVTIDHLLTHTGGIRDWTGLQNLAPGKPQAWTLIVKQRGLNFKPGDEFSYSNSGVVLMKEIISRAGGMPFGEFARQRLFEPLGMKSTSYRTDMRDVVKNRAIAYEKENGNWRMAMLLDHDRGGGGILTSALDLVTWGDAIAGKRLSAFVSEKIQEPATLNNGRKLGHARGLFLDDAGGVRMIWHGGSADGYQAILSHFPEYDLSIAVMCNAGKLDQSEFAGRIFNLMVPSAPKDRDDGDGPPPAIPDGMDLSAKSGLYYNERTGAFLRLSIDRGRFRIADGPGLVAETNERFRRWGSALFFMSGDAFELNFTSADEFDLKSMEGTTSRYRRVVPPSLTPGELKPLAGRYASDEIGSTITVTSGKRGLEISLAHLPERKLDFRPLNRDVFQFNRMMIRFERNQTGKVVGLELSNPLVRNLKFMRTKE